MNEANEALEIAKSIAKPFEGLRLRPYLCPAGVPTIGYGTTRYPDGRRVTLADPPIAEDQASAYLMHDMTGSVSAAARICPVLAMYPNRWGAVADFVYNLGAGNFQASTLRRRINQEDWEEAVRELRKWVYAGGKKLHGLVLRREAEAKFLK
jgi:lysozyme